MMTKEGDEVVGNGGWVMCRCKKEKGTGSREETTTPTVVPILKPGLLCAKPLPATRLRTHLGGQPHGIRERTFTSGPLTSVLNFEQCLPDTLSGIQFHCGILHAAITSSWLVCSLFNLLRHHGLEPHFSAGSPNQ
jgi:hypothetical protein